MNARTITFAVLFALCLAATTRADVRPDPTLWDIVHNPSGERIVPVVAYHSGNGNLSINTLGLNQLLETFDGRQIGGDDVGMISMVIEGPAAEQFFWDGCVTCGVIWNSTYFDGRQQLFGIGTQNEYAMPTAEIPIFKYPQGLSANDFGNVQLGVNFAWGQPGDILNGSVQIVPEPSSVSLCFIAGLVWFWSRTCRVH